MFAQLKIKPLFFILILLLISLTLYRNAPIPAQAADNTTYALPGREPFPRPALEIVDCSDPAAVTRCNDGMCSTSTGSGTCSSHGGVAGPISGGGSGDSSGDDADSNSTAESPILDLSSAEPEEAAPQDTPVPANPPEVSAPSPATVPESGSILVGHSHTILLLSISTLALLLVSAFRSIR